MYVWAKPGRYKVTLTAVDFAAQKVERAKFTFSVEGKPPTPPGPEPTPVPPDPPGPKPDPAPIPTAGFRVLIVYETSELSKLPAAQQSVIYGKAMRDYLNSKCVLGPDSKTHEWRMWDKDTDASAESQLWQDAMKRGRTSVPWLIVSNGKTGFEGMLPATVEDTLKLLAKYEIAPKERK